MASDCGALLRAGVVDDYFGANFLEPSNSNVSWDYNGHGAGTAQTLAGVNDGVASTNLGVCPKAGPPSSPDLQSTRPSALCTLRRSSHRSLSDQWLFTPCSAADLSWTSERASKLAGTACTPIHTMADVQECKQNFKDQGDTECKYVNHESLSVTPPAKTPIRGGSSVAVARSSAGGFAHTYRCRSSRARLWMGSCMCPSQQPSRASSGARPTLRTSPRWAGASALAST